MGTWTLRVISKFQALEQLNITLDTFWEEAERVRGFLGFGVLLGLGFQVEGWGFEVSSLGFRGLREGLGVGAGVS